MYRPRLTGSRASWEGQMAREVHEVSRRWRIFSSRKFIGGSNFNQGYSPRFLSLRLEKWRDAGRCDSDNFSTRRCCHSLRKVERPPPFLWQRLDNKSASLGQSYQTLCYSPSANQLFRSAMRNMAHVHRGSETGNGVGKAFPWQKLSARVKNHQIVVNDRFSVFSPGFHVVYLRIRSRFVFSLWRHRIVFSTVTS